MTFHIYIFYRNKSGYPIKTLLWTQCHSECIIFIGMWIFGADSSHHWAFVSYLNYAIRLFHSVSCDIRNFGQLMYLFICYNEMGMICICDGGRAAAMVEHEWNCLLSTVFYNGVLLYFFFILVCCQKHEHERFHTHFNQNKIYCTSNNSLVTAEFCDMVKSKPATVIVCIVSFNTMSLGIMCALAWGKRDLLEMNESCH